MTFEFGERRDADLTPPTRAHRDDPVAVTLTKLFGIQMRSTFIGVHSQMVALTRDSSPSGDRQQFPL